MLAGHSLGGECDQIKYHTPFLVLNAGTSVAVPFVQ